MIWRVGYREGEHYHTLPTPVFEHREDAQMELWIKRNRWLRRNDLWDSEGLNWYVEASAAPDEPAA